MNHGPHPAFRRPSALAAFTLIELLTVIAIIAILMALLFPAIIGAKEAGRKAQASNDVHNIVASVKSYFTEYGRYPDVEPPSGKTGTGSTADAIVGDKTIASIGALDDNSALFYTLRSISAGVNAGYVMNPRRIVFFEGKQASNPNSPKAGFLTATAGGGGAAGTDSYFDPWGKQYFVVLDTNYDNQIDVPYTDFKSSGGSGGGSTSSAPRVGVGAFSLGKDNQLGNAGNGMYKTGTTKSDDIISWQ